MASQRVTQSKRVFPCGVNEHFSKKKKFKEEIGTFNEKKVEMLQLKFAIKACN